MAKKGRKKLIITLLSVFGTAFCVCIGCLIYCGIMTSYTRYTDNGTFEPVPAEYKKKATQQGKIVAFTYKTSTYYGEETWPNSNLDTKTAAAYAEREDRELEKKIYVYLPFGYDEAADKRYQVLYHMHGTTCDGTTLIKGEGKDSETKRLLDNMIENGDIKPMIVVFPTWYNGLDLDEKDPDYLISHFGTELKRDVMPAVEKQFKTYAGLKEGMTEAEMEQAFEDSRAHRAVSGYSRGGVLTWNLFAEMQNCFQWYVPMSGDYLCELFTATQESCTEKTEALTKKLDDQGYGKEDFFVYSTVGALDFAYRGVNMQFHSMLRQPEYFQYGENAEEGNFYLCTAPRVWHGDTKAPMFFYNALSVIFHT